MSSTRGETTLASLGPVRLAVAALVGDRGAVGGSSTQPTARASRQVEGHFDATVARSRGDGGIRRHGVRCPEGLVHHRG